MIIRFHHSGIICFSIPAGKHIITFSNVAVTSFSANELQAKILSFTGNLMSIAYGMKDIKFAYDSQTRTLLSLNREPTWVKVDRQDYKFSIMEGNDCFSIFLHQVIIISRSEWVIHFPTV